MSIYIDSTTGRLSDTAVRRPHARSASHNGHMTWDRLVAMIKATHGQGHRDDYLPWNMVGKHDYSIDSNIGHQPAPEYGHVHHPRSREQRRLFDTLAWLGAWDVRDHYPVWPWAHEHPATGLPGMGRLPRVPGLMEIAEDVPLDHPTYVGTSIPRPYTFDCLTTWRTSNGRFELRAFQVASRDADSSAAVRFTGYHRKVVLLSRYCETCDILFKVVDLTKLPQQVFVNLDAIRPRLDAAEREVMKRSEAYQALVQACQCMGYTKPVSEVIRRVAVGRGLPQLHWQQALHLALWDLDVDHDLSHPLEMWEPLRPGGFGLREKVRATVL